MGLFSSVFGKKASTPDMDGAWLLLDRRSSWRSCGQIFETCQLELAESSCFVQGEIVWCIARVVNKSENHYYYMGCMVLPPRESTILIVVERIEGFDGAIIRKDRWLVPSKALNTEPHSGAKELVKVAPGQGRFNDYKEMPPFAVTALLKRNTK